MNNFSVWVNHSIEAEEVDFFTALTTAFKAFERGEESVNVYANGPEDQRKQAEMIMDALDDMGEVRTDE
jgi:hypothetical protein